MATVQINDVQGNMSPSEYYLPPFAYRKYICHPGQVAVAIFIPHQHSMCEDTLDGVVVE